MATQATKEPSEVGYIDIGANLTDPVFRGKSHGKTVHADDFDQMLARAYSARLHRIIITGLSLSESKQAVAIAHTDDRLYCTVGCHPVRSGNFRQSDCDQMLTIIKANKHKVVAIGECGLDYARLARSPADAQRRAFEQQLTLAEATRLPLFLHSRDAGDDFRQILHSNRHRFPASGVVHAFTGSADELRSALDMGLSIGLAGCSFKTEANLDVIKLIPSDRLMIETDAPYCEIRPSYAGHRFIKHNLTSYKHSFQAGSMLHGRNEPCTINQVLEVVAGVRGQDPQTLTAQIYDNTTKLFFPSP